MEFAVAPGFCKNCASILPMNDTKGKIKCQLCKKEYGIEVFGSMEASYTIHFNKRDRYLDPASKTGETEAEGPVVERKCSKCGNDKMSYATLQLRSADEGQTVFYTCTKCKYKETENS